MSRLLLPALALASTLLPAFPSAALADCVRTALVTEQEGNELREASLGTEETWIVTPGLGFPSTISTSYFGSGFDPSGVAVDRAGTTAYVTEGKEFSGVYLENGGITLIASEFESNLKGVALTPDGSTAYVVGGSLFAVDLTTYSVTTVASNLGDTLGVAVHPGGATALVTAVFLDETSFLAVDLLTGNVRHVAHLVAPVGAAVDASGTMAYVVEDQGLSAIDLTTGAKTRVAEGLTLPLGIALSGDETVAFVTEEAGRLLAVDLRTGAVATVTSELRGPSGVSFSAATGKAYVTESELGQLATVDLSTGQITRVNPAFSRPGGVAFDRDRLIAYVAETTSGEVSSARFGYGESADPVTIASGLDDPFGVALNATTGTLLVTETGSGELTAVSVAAGQISVVASGLNSPQGVVLNSTGRLAYVLEPETLAAVDLTTGGVSRIPLGPNIGLLLPSFRSGLALSPDDHTIYVTSWTDFAGVYLLAADVATGAVRQVANIDRGGIPVGVALDDTGGTVYVIGLAQKTLAVDLATGRVTEINSDLTSPSGIAFRCSPCAYHSSCSDRNPCTVDTCEFSGGECVFTLLADGTRCSDDRFCGAPASCQAGSCEPDTPVCDDQNPCTEDICESASSSCLYSPRPFGTPCPDGAFCNGEEICGSEGACLPAAPIACDDTNTCTADVCNEALRSCVSQPLQTALVTDTAGDISEVDLATGTVRVLVPGLAEMTRVVLNKAGTTAYVSEWAWTPCCFGPVPFHGEVSAVDLTSGRIRTVATDLGRVQGIALSPSETTLYVSEQISGEVSAIDIATGSVSALATGLSDPGGLALNTTGTTLYVLESDRLSKVDLSTGIVTAVAELDSYPFLYPAIALGPDETVAYVIRRDFPSGVLLAIDLATGSASSVAMFPSSSEPYAVAIDPYGAAVYVTLSNFYVTQGITEYYGELFRIDPRTGEMNTVSRGSWTGWRGLAVDATSATAFVATSRSLLAVSLETGAIRTAAASVLPGDIAVDAAGTTAYVNSNDGFSALDLASGRFRTIVPGSFATKIALDRSERTAFVLLNIGLGHELAAVDLLTGQVRATGAVFYRDSSPQGLALYPDGGTAYVTYYEPNPFGFLPRLVAIDTASGQTTLLAEGIGGPIAINREGTQIFSSHRSVNLVTGETRDYGAGLNPLISGLALNAAETTLLVAQEYDFHTYEDGELFAVDVVNGPVTPVTSGLMYPTGVVLRKFGCGPNRPPVAAAGADAQAECNTPGGAFWLLDGSGSADPDSTPGTSDDLVSFEWFDAVGGLIGSGPILYPTLPLGTHAITLRVTDRAGATSTDEVMVTVADTIPPAMSIGLTPAVLWPPNHRMVDVAASVNVIDACGEASVLLSSATSSEPDDAAGNGDGSTVNDVQAPPAGSTQFTFGLRAERAADGPGRTYAITYMAIDSAGNSSSATAAVTVPHDRQGITEPLTLAARDNGAGTLLEWKPVDGAHFYNVVRGEVRNLKDMRDFFSLGPLICVASATPQTSTEGLEDAGLPPPAEAFFYLVEYNDGSTSSYGSAEAAKARDPSSEASGCSTFPLPHPGG